MVSVNKHIFVTDGPKDVKTRWNDVENLKAQHGFVVRGALDDPEIARLEQVLWAKKYESVNSPPVLIIHSQSQLEQEHWVPMRVI